MWTLLLWPGTPFVLALAILYGGVRILRRARWPGLAPASLPARVGGWMLTGLGAVLLFGATVTVLELAWARHKYPPPGRIVSVDGVNLHIWCEGPTAAATLLLVGGGHSQGLWMRPIQIALRDRWRACMVDRPGLGWSDRGHVPMTMDDELAQFHGAIAAAGEHPAVAVIGHSAGGQVAMNYASAYPDEVKTMVLLDPSQPAHSLIDWSGGGFALYNHWMPVFATMYGLPYIDALNPLRAADSAWMAQVFGDWWEPLIAWDLRPSASIASRAMIDVREDPLSIVRTPGSLPRQSMLLISQQPEPPRPPAWLHASTGRRFENYAALHAFAQTEALTFSPRSELVWAPKDSTHYFLYKEPAFTVSHINAFLNRELAPAAVEAIPGH
jgi:pimeloyl-ACP methyl ester carboxylesterase